MEVVRCIEQCACGGGSVTDACESDNEDMGVDGDILVVVGRSTFEIVVCILGLILVVDGMLFEEEG